MESQQSPLGLTLNHLDDARQELVQVADGNVS